MDRIEIGRQLSNLAALAGSMLQRCIAAGATPETTHCWHEIADRLAELAHKCKEAATGDEGR